MFSFKNKFVSACILSFLDGELILVRKLQGSPIEAGKVEKWLSSPTVKTSERSLVSTNRFGLKRVNPDEEMDSNKASMNVINSIVATRQSPFRTPPSLSYSLDKVIMASLLSIIIKVSWALASN